MADKKLSELSARGTVVATDLLYIVPASGSSYYTTVADLMSGFTEAAEDETITGDWTFTGDTTFDGDVTINGDIHISGSWVETVYALSGTSVEIDPSNGTIQYLDLTGNTTFTLATTWQNSETVTLLLQVDNGAGGSYTVTWPTMMWRDSVEPTLTASTTASEYDIVVLTKIGSVYYAQHAGYFGTVT